MAWIYLLWDDVLYLVLFYQAIGFFFLFFWVITGLSVINLCMVHICMAMILAWAWGRRQKKEIRERGHA